MQRGILSVHNNNTIINPAVLGTVALVLMVITAVSGMGGWIKPDNISSSSPAIRLIEGKPLIFERNDGQAGHSIHYRALSPYYTVAFTSRGAEIRLTKGAGASRTLAIQALNANPVPAISGEKPLPTRHHYLIGREATQWHRNIPTFSEVLYSAIYPGIDLLFRGNENRLEYDFIVAPGANPEVIRLGFPGVDRMAVDGQGHLHMTLDGHQITQPAPFIYQEKNGAKARIEGGYRIDGESKVGFTIAAYDPELPLIIDPILIYSSFIGGSGDDKAMALTTDNAGNLYIAGSTNSPDLPLTSPLDGTCGSDGNCDAAVSGGTTVLNSDFFVTKMGPDGIPVYTTYLGGSQSDVATGIAVNNAGEVHLSGYTLSTDFPTTPGAFDPACTDTSPADGFCDEGVETTVVKLNASGSGLVYSTYLGGGADDYAGGIALDGAGAAYVTGNTASADFPLATGTYAGEEDVFAAKLDPSGATLAYATYIGGIGTDIGMGIDVDGSGNAYLTGYTASADFPVTTGALDTLCGESGACDGQVDDDNDGNFETIYTFDGFVTKLDNSGATLLYSTFLGGERYDYANAIHVDGAGNAYVAGETRSAKFPPASSTNAYQDSIAGSYDGFLARLNASGTSLDFFTYIGGTHGDTATDLAVDGNGDIYLLGSTFSRDFPALKPFQNPPPQRQDNTVIVYNADAWLAKLSADASSLRYSSTFGGQHNDYGTAVDVDGNGRAYMTGYTISVDMPVTSTASQDSHGNEIPGYTVAGVDSYVAIISDGDGDLAVDLTGSPATITQGEQVTYQALVVNIGPVPAEGVYLDYESIKDTAAVTASPSQGTCSNPAAKIRCNLGRLSANGGSASITFTISPHGAGQLVNNVSVGARMSDSDLGNNTASVTTTVKSISFAAGPDRDDHGHHDGHDDGSSGGGMGVLMFLSLATLLAWRRGSLERTLR